PIARWGPRGSVSCLAGEREGEGLIGKCGAGFYAAFMVADRRGVTSRRAGRDDAWVGRSSGRGGFGVAPASKAQGERVVRGTEVCLHLKEDAKRYLDPQEVERIVRAYSDHILFPIELGGESAKARQINAASALWQRAKS